MGFSQLIVVVFLLALSSTKLMANELNAETVADDGETINKNSHTVKWFPFIFYTEETNLGFGAGTLRTLNNTDARTGTKNNQRFDSIKALVFYTLNKNFSISLTPEFYFDNEMYNLKMDVNYSQSPSLFFGTGEDLAKNHEGEKYVIENRLLQGDFLAKVYRSFRFGARYEWLSFKVTEITSGGLLQQNQFIGQEGGAISGAGIIIDQDNRDNTFAAASGGYHQFIAMKYTTDLGSDFEYNQYTIDLRQYFALSKKGVLALQALAQSTTGDVPFNRLVLLGGSANMRGIYAGRFRDKNRLTLQSEYRHSFNSRWLFTVFASAGQVAVTRNALDGESVKYSAGGGIRYALDPKNKLHIRFDLGFSATGSSTVLVLGEAF